VRGRPAAAFTAPFDARLAAALRASLAAALAAFLVVATCAAAFAGDGSADPRLAQAKRLLREGRARTALELYRSLVRTRPDDVEVRMGLAEAAIATGDKEIARPVIDAGAGADPRNPDWIRLRGMLLAADGKPDEALAAWRGLLTSIPDREAAYRATAGLFSSAKRLSEAIALLAEGRGGLGDSLLFCTDLIALHDLTGDPRSAVVECGRAVAAGLLSAEAAAAKSASLGADGHTARDAAASITALALVYPDRAALFGFLAWLRLSAGDCDGARAAAGAADSIAGGCGETRFLFGERTGDGACAASGLAALREAAAACPQEAVGWRANRLLADRLVAAGEYAEGRDLIRRMLDVTPKESRERSVGLLSLGRILLEGTREPAKAREAFDAAGARDPRSVEAWFARLGAARAALYLGDFAGARKGFLEAVDRGPHDDVREAGLFGLADVAFMSDDTTNGEGEIRTILTTYPKGLLVNDAAERLVFVAEGADAAPGLLKEFADAHREGLGGGAASAIGRFDAIVADYPLAGLRDDAALEAALLVAWTGDATSAIARLSAFVEQFPDSPLAARALLEKGRLRWRRLGDAAGARDDCENLLLRYADSLIADEARALIEQLTHAAPLVAAPPPRTSG